jgi:hypothetical protein
MAFSQIAYGSKTISFPRVPTDVLILPSRATLANLSLSGKPETLNIASGFTVQITFPNFRNNDTTEADLKTALFEAAQWAESRAIWTFITQSTITVNTTLDATAVAGVSSIPVTSATGIVSGSRYVIEKAEEVEIVKASNTATDPVSISSALNYSFPSGSRFRAYNYLPMIGSIRITEHTYSQFFNVEISGQVDRRSLA